MRASLERPLGGARLWTFIRNGCDLANERRVGRQERLVRVPTRRLTTIDHAPGGGPRPGELEVAWGAARKIETSRRREVLSFSHHAEVAALKLRTERKAGVLLAEREKHPPGPDPSHRVRDLPPKLEEIGISYKQSSRWQLEASVPEEEFERHRDI